MVKPRNRPRWNFQEHARWQKKIARGKISRSDEALAESRADRVLGGGANISSFSPRPSGER
jgi:hypothetical protein